MQVKVSRLTLRDLSKELDDDLRNELQSGSASGGCAAATGVLQFSTPPRCTSTASIVWAGAGHMLAPRSRGA